MAAPRGKGLRPRLTSGPHSRWCHRPFDWAGWYICGVLTRRSLGALFVAALVIRLAAVVLIQPRTGVDGVGFIASAQALVEGGPRALASLSAQHSPLYSLFLAGGLLAGLSVGWFAALVQAVLGATTAVVVARFTARETHSRAAGLCAGAIAAIQISFVFWTAYVLSETLFLFFLVIAADTGLHLRNSNHPLRDSLGVTLLAILAVATRPTGIAFVVALLVLVALVGGPKRQTLLAGIGVPLLLLAAVAFATGASANVMDWLRSGVQNGLLETDAGRATSGVDLDVNPPPIAATLPANQQQEFITEGPLNFATHHPEFVAAQVTRKLKLFWTPVLPEYSVPHALGSGAYFIAFYVLAVLGLVRVRRYDALTTLCLASVFLFTLTSLITIVDYDQRYRLPAELFLVPLAGVGLTWLLTRVGILGPGVHPVADGRDERVSTGGRRQLAGSDYVRSQHRFPVPE